MVKQAYSAKATKATCSNCSKTFSITESDLKFYAHIDVPQPTHCPECRAQRRFAWRNERNLHAVSCALCGATTLSVTRPENGYTVYCTACYTSDKWDAKTYARDIDFSKPFFEQFNKLLHAVPQRDRHSVNAQNSDYCNYVGHGRNSYLCFGSIEIEDCLYGSPYYSKGCVDTTLVRNCELCYECITSEGLYNCKWCMDCYDSRDLILCYDVRTSHDCFGSAGLRNAQYMIFNEQHTEVEYKAFMAKLNCCDDEQMERMRKKFEAIRLKTPHQFMTGQKNEDVAGNYITQSKNAHHVFDISRGENITYAAQVIDQKDCMDVNYTESDELVYEYWGYYRNQQAFFSMMLHTSNNVMYSAMCEGSSELFGCAGVKNGKYMIFNREYTVAEYRALKAKLIAHMKETGEWGEFFPAKYSNFAYNESVAQEYFPLSQEQAKEHGLGWYQKPEPDSSLFIKKIPRDSTKVADTITNNILKCSTCSKGYKLVKPELEFYRQQQLPIPVHCPDCRHLARMKQRTERALWNRQCMCTQPQHDHASAQCVRGFITAYNPNRPELIYCEYCYQKTML